jgi:hypothetical protein
MIIQKVRIKVLLSGFRKKIISRQCKIHYESTYFIYQSVNLIPASENLGSNVVTHFDNGLPEKTGIVQDPSIKSFLTKN